MPRGINAYDEGRIQGRNVANANSSNIVSPGIVTDGLVMHLDAGNYQSYPIAGTSWYDLSDRLNNGTLINGPTFSSAGGGSIVFDGVNDRGTFASPITASSPQTYEIWVKAIAGSAGNFGYVLHNNAASSQIGTAYMVIGYAGSTLQTNEIFAAFNGAWSTMGTGVIGNTTTVRQIVLTWNGSAQTAYIDGIQKVSQSLTSTPINFSTTTSFADYSLSTVRPINGNIYSIKIYNRAIVADEVSQNFNATRARFNI